jgi:hypothetical protein
MEEEFQKVREEVEKLTGENKSENFLDLTDRKIIYSIIISIIVLTLIFVRPSFLYVKGEKEDERKFSFTRLILYTIILSVIFIVFYEFLERRKFLKT